VSGQSGSFRIINNADTLSWVTLPCSVEGSNVQDTQLKLLYRNNLTFDSSAMAILAWRTASKATI